MSDWFADYNAGDMAFRVNEDAGITANGDFLMHLSDCAALNMSTGKVDMISDWPEEKPAKKKRGASLFDDDEKDDEDD